MVRRKLSKVQSRELRVVFWALLLLTLNSQLSTSLLGQQTPGPIFSVNSKAVQGVGPGDYSYGLTVDLYVSPTGSDTTGDGTIGNPYQTIGRALKDIPLFVSHHYIVHLAAGTYRELVDLSGRYFGGKITSSAGVETNLSDAAIELQGDPLDPDSYVISGADAGAPTVPVRSYVVKAASANFILSGISLQYGDVSGLLQAGGRGEIRSCTVRHFTSPSMRAALRFHDHAFANLTGNNTISDVSHGIFADIFSYVTGGTVSDTVNISGVTSGPGIEAGEDGAVELSPTTNITGTNVPGSAGVFPWEGGTIILIGASIDSFDKCIEAEAGNVYIDTPSLSNCTTGVQASWRSQIDWYVSNPTFTNVPTPYALSQGSRVLGPGLNLIDGTLVSTGAIDLNAGGANQSITLTPSGNGQVVVPGSSGSGMLLRAGPDASSFSSTLQGYLNGGATETRSLNPSGGGYTGLLSALQSNATSFQTALYAVAESTNSSTRGAFSTQENDVYLSGIGDVTGASAYYSLVSMQGSGTATNIAGFWAGTNTKTSGTVQNNYGIYVADQIGVGTNNYAIYTAGNAPAKFGGAVIAGLNTVSFSATPTFDASLGNTQKITLTGNVTSSTLANASAGEQIHFFVCQDASGGHTFAWPSNLTGGMTVSSAGSTCSAQSFIFDGTNAYALSPGVTNM